MDIDTPAWARDAVFYQVFPDRLARSGRIVPVGELEPWDAPPTTHGFKGGDLFGLIAHLDRLRALGINALYLNPVFTSASNHRYHTDDYFQVDPMLGGNAALRELIDQAHARDMRVVLDGVFNHCGRGWLPFHHVVENGMASPYRDWFHLSDAVRTGRQQLTPFPSPEQLQDIGRRQAAGEPSGAASKAVLGFECWWDLPALPKIRLEDARAREHILSVGEHWIRFGIDGWRLDVAEEVSAEFWREFRARVRAVDAQAYLVAEVWHHLPEWLAGDMFDAFMNYPLTTALTGFAAQGRLEPGVPIPAEYEGQLGSLDGAGLWARIEELRQLNGPAVTAVQLNLLDSHDTPRLLTLCGRDLASVRLAMLLQMTLPGAPCVYYGDEVGLAGSMDPDCRRAFPADPGRWEREPYGWLADLIALRHSSRAFRDAELSLLGATGAAIAYLRRHGDERFVVVANAGDDPLAWSVTLPLEPTAAEPIALRGAAAGQRTARVADGKLLVSVPAREGMVVRLRG